MLQRPFGNTGLSVSALGLGAGHIGSDAMPDRDALALLDSALELGITFVDTARGYGRSEERIGAWLGPHRERVVLSTKVGYDVEGETDWTAGAITGGVDRALKTLRTDVLDVVFLHSCPLEVLERGEVVEALLAARDAGKVRVAGYSGENDELAWAVASGHFGAVQTSVSIADQASLHRTLPAAADAGIGVVAKRPLANAPWRFAERPVGAYAELYWERLRTLALEPADGDWAGTAARFSTFAPGVSTAIAGTSSPQHLADVAAAVARGPLPDDEQRRWTDAFAPHAAEWPGDI